MLDLVPESYGVHRSTIPWGFWATAAARIASDHKDQRLPWISVSPPSPGAAGWQGIASGEHDEAIMSLAETLASKVKLPALVTFHADPSGAATDHDAALWSAAYCHTHDLLDQGLALRLVSDPPIIDDWLFAPANHRQDPGHWLTRGVLERTPLLGLNLYESASGETFARRIPRVLNWLADRGFEQTMLGIADSGHQDNAPRPSASESWLTESLRWVAKNTDRVGVVCYTSRGDDSHDVYWAEADLRSERRRRFSWTERAVMTV